MQKHTQRGFTLVELAIVMVIIGVLLGGVLKGQELITNARASATIADIKNYEAAVNTFQDAYDAIPGDMPNANVRLPNCPVPSACSNAVSNTPATLGDGRLSDAMGARGPARMGAENIAFFAQLAAADLIGGVDPTVVYGRGTGNSWSSGIWPTAPIGGGYSPGWTDGINTAGFTGILTDATSSIPRRGIYLALNDYPGLDLSATLGQGSVLQPSHALRIDNKLDDGSPYTGFVRGAGTVGNADSNCATATDYNGRSTQPVCYLYIRLGG